MNLPPLALYIHIPWCEKKCPYCDFNSHTVAAIPEQAYVAQLIEELQSHQALLAQRPIESIFFGGGTPSLFSPAAVGQILAAVNQIGTLQNPCEITLEANPSSAEQRNFRGYRSAGVNRISIGIQSFQAKYLDALGRIHSSTEASAAVLAAQQAGFDNINIDLMYGLENQHLDEAIADLQQAIALSPQHISWYQLTIEANTAFYNAPPSLPPEEHIIEMETHGRQLLSASGYMRYEVSAYAQPKRESIHNLNYWEFGDYLGVGAGAHSKISKTNGDIIRLANTRLPQHYMNRDGINKTASTTVLSAADKQFEFMMNALRLRKGVKTELFEQRTGLSLGQIETTLDALSASKHMENPYLTKQLVCTEAGYELLNSVVEQFLDC